MAQQFLHLLLSTLLYGESPTGRNGGSDLSHHWSYKGDAGPGNWSLLYPTCSGTRQSPVNIQDRNIIYQELPPFRFNNFDGLRTAFRLTNNGHTASISIFGNMSVEGGGLDGQYNTAELHFHWGSSNNLGSEHSINGRKYPLEMHIVSYATKYGSLSNAMRFRDGLAVLGTFFDIARENPYFRPIEEGLVRAKYAGNFTDLQSVNLLGLIPADTTRYYRYYGSLTTPPCHQSVMWTLFEDVQYISPYQIQMLRRLYESHYDGGHGGHGGHGFGNNHHTQMKNLPLEEFLMDNYRPTQPHFDRVINCNILRYADPQYIQHSRMQLDSAPRQNDFISQRLSQINVDALFNKTLQRWLQSKGLSPNALTPEQLGMHAQGQSHVSPQFQQQGSVNLGHPASVQGNAGSTGSGHGTQHASHQGSPHGVSQGQVGGSAPGGTSQMGTGAARPPDHLDLQVMQTQSIGPNGEELTEIQVQLDPNGPHGAMTQAELQHLVGDPAVMDQIRQIVSSQTGGAGQIHEIIVSVPPTGSQGAAPSRYQDPQAFGGAGTPAQGSTVPFDKNVASEHVVERSLDVHLHPYNLTLNVRILPVDAFVTNTVSVTLPLTHASRVTPTTVFVNDHVPSSVPPTEHSSGLSAPPLDSRSTAHALAQANQLKLTSNFLDSTAGVNHDQLKGSGGESPGKSSDVLNPTLTLQDTDKRLRDVGDGNKAIKEPTKYGHFLMHAEIKDIFPVRNTKTARDNHLYYQASKHSASEAEKISIRHFLNVNGMGNVKHRLKRAAQAGPGTVKSGRSYDNLISQNIPIKNLFSRRQIRLDNARRRLMTSRDPMLRRFLSTSVNTDPLITRPIGQVPTSTTTVNNKSSDRLRKEQPTKISRTRKAPSVTRRTMQSSTTTVMPTNKHTPAIHTTSSSSTSASGPSNTSSMESESALNQNAQTDVNKHSMTIENPQITLKDPIITNGAGGNSFLKKLPTRRPDPMSVGRNNVKSSHITSHHEGFSISDNQSLDNAVSNLSNRLPYEKRGLIMARKETHNRRDISMKPVLDKRGLIRTPEVRIRSQIPPLTNAHIPAKVTKDAAAIVPVADQTNKDLGAAGRMLNQERLGTFSVASDQIRSFQAVSKSKDSQNMQSNNVLRNVPLPAIKTSNNMTITTVNNTVNNAVSTASNRTTSTKGEPTSSGSTYASNITTNQSEMKQTKSTGQRSNATSATPRQTVKSILEPQGSADSLIMSSRQAGLRGQSAPDVSALPEAQRHQDAVTTAATTTTTTTATTTTTNAVDTALSASSTKQTMAEQTNIPNGGSPEAYSATRQTVVKQAVRTNREFIDIPTLSEKTVSKLRILTNQGSLGALSTSIGKTVTKHNVFTSHGSPDVLLTSAGKTVTKQTLPGNQGSLDVPPTSTGTTVTKQTLPGKQGSLDVPPTSTGTTVTKQTLPGKQGSLDVPSTSTGATATKQTLPGNQGYLDVPSTSTGITVTKQTLPGNQGSLDVPPTSTGTMVTKQTLPGNQGSLDVPPTSTGTTAIKQTLPGNQGYLDVPPTSTGITVTKQTLPGNQGYLDVPPTSTGTTVTKQTLPGKQGLLDVPPTSTVTTVTKQTLPGKQGSLDVPPTSTVTTVTKQTLPGNQGYLDVPPTSTGITVTKQTLPGNQGSLDVPPTSTGTTVTKQTLPGKQGSLDVPPTSTGTTVTKQTLPGKQGSLDVPPTSTGATATKQTLPGKQGSLDVPPTSTGTTAIKQTLPGNQGYLDVPPTSTGITVTKQTLPGNQGSLDVPKQTLPGNQGSLDVPPTSTGTTVMKTTLPRNQGSLEVPPISITEHTSSNHTASTSQLSPTPVTGQNVPIEGFHQTPSTTIRQTPTGIVQTLNTVTLRGVLKDLPAHALDLKQTGIPSSTFTPVQQLTAGALPVVTSRGNVDVDALPLDSTQMLNSFSVLPQLTSIISLLKRMLTTDANSTVVTTSGKLSSKDTTASSSNQPGSSNNVPSAVFSSNQTLTSVSMTSEANTTPSTQTHTNSINSASSVQHIKLPSGNTSSNQASTSSIVATQQMFTNPIILDIPTISNSSSVTAPTMQIPTSSTRKQPKLQPLLQPITDNPATTQPVTKMQTFVERSSISFPAMITKRQAPLDKLITSRHISPATTEAFVDNLPLGSKTSAQSFAVNEQPLEVQPKKTGTTTNNFSQTTMMGRNTERSMSFTNNPSIPKSSGTSLRKNIHLDPLLQPTTSLPVKKVLPQTTPRTQPRTPQDPTHNTNTPAGTKIVQLGSGSASSATSVTSGSHIAQPIILSDNVATGQSPGPDLPLTNNVPANTPDMNSGTSQLGSPQSVPVTSPGSALVVQDATINSNAKTASVVVNSTEAPSIQQDSAVQPVYLGSIQPGSSQTSGNNNFNSVPSPQQSGSVILVQDATINSNIQTAGEVVNSRQATGVQPGPILNRVHLGSAQSGSTQTSGINELNSQNAFGRGNVTGNTGQSIQVLDGPSSSRATGIQVPGDMGIGPPLSAVTVGSSASKTMGQDGISGGGTQILDMPGSVGGAQIDPLVEPFVVNGEPASAVRDVTIDTKTGVQPTSSVENREAIKSAPFNEQGLFDFSSRAGKRWSLHGKLKPSSNPVTNTGYSEAYSYESGSFPMSFNGESPSAALEILDSSPRTYQSGVNMNLPATDNFKDSAPMQPSPGKTQIQTFGDLRLPSQSQTTFLMPESQQFEHQGMSHRQESAIPFQGSDLQGGVPSRIPFPPEEGLSGLSYGEGMEQLSEMLSAPVPQRRTGRFHQRNTNTIDGQFRVPTTNHRISQTNSRMTLSPRNIIGNRLNTPRKAAQSVDASFRQQKKQRQTQQRASFRLNTPRPSAQPIDASFRQQPQKQSQTQQRASFRLNTLRPSAQPIDASFRLQPQMQSQMQQRASFRLNTPRKSVQRVDAVFRQKQRQLQQRASIRTPSTIRSVGQKPNQQRSLNNVFSSRRTNYIPRTKPVTLNSPRPEQTTWNVKRPEAASRNVQSPIAARQRQNRQVLTQNSNPPHARLNRLAKLGQNAYRTTRLPSRSPLPGSRVQNLPKVLERRSRFQNKTKPVHINLIINQQNRIMSNLVANSHDSKKSKLKSQSRSFQIANKNTQVWDSRKPHTTLVQRRFFSPTQRRQSLSNAHRVPSQLSRALNGHTQRTGSNIIQRQLQRQW